MYGFNIRTKETLRFLRSGGGAETLDIVAAFERFLQLLSDRYG